MNKLGIFLVIVGITLAGFSSAQPVGAANTGVTGRVLDGRTIQGWAYGAEILVLQTTGASIGVKGTATLDSSGYFTVIYGTTDTLNLCFSMGGCSTADDFSKIVVQISFKCDHETLNTGVRKDKSNSTDPSCPVNEDLSGNPVPLYGLPGAMEIEFTDNYNAVTKDLGDIDANSSPTVITLEAISAESTTGISLLMIAAFVLILIGFSLIVIYRLRQKTI
jgi:hypothetical protein